MKIELPYKMELKMQNLKIFYEDNHIIVVQKPNNIPSQADKTGDEEDRKSVV